MRATSLWQDPQRAGMSRRWGRPRNPPACAVATVIASALPPWHDVQPISSDLWMPLSNFTRMSEWQTPHMRAVLDGLAPVGGADRGFEALSWSGLGCGSTTFSVAGLSLIHISEPTRLLSISYAV